MNKTNKNKLRLFSALSSVLLLPAVIQADSTTTYTKNLINIEKTGVHGGTEDTMINFQEKEKFNDQGIYEGVSYSINSSTVATTAGGVEISRSSSGDIGSGKLKTTTEVDGKTIDSTTKREEDGEYVTTTTVGSKTLTRDTTVVGNEATTTTKVGDATVTRTTTNDDGKITTKFSVTGKDGSNITGKPGSGISTSNTKTNDNGTTVERDTNITKGSGRTKTYTVTNSSGDSVTRSSKVAQGSGRSTTTNADVKEGTITRDTVANKDGRASATSLESSEGNSIDRVAVEAQGSGKISRTRTIAPTEDGGVQSNARSRATTLNDGKVDTGAEINRGRKRITRSKDSGRSSSSFSHQGHQITRESINIKQGSGITDTQTKFEEGDVDDSSTKSINITNSGVTANVNGKTVDGETIQTDVNTIKTDVGATQNYVADSIENKVEDVQSDASKIEDGVKDVGKNVDESIQDSNLKANFTKITDGIKKFVSEVYDSFNLKK